MIEIRKMTKTNTETKTSNKDEDTKEAKTSHGNGTR